MMRFLILVLGLCLASSNRVASQPRAAVDWSRIEFVVAIGTITDRSGHPLVNVNETVSRIARATLASETHIAQIDTLRVPAAARRRRVPTLRITFEVSELTVRQVNARTTEAQARVQAVLTREPGRRLVGTTTGSGALSQMSSDGNSAPELGEQALAQATENAVRELSSTFLAARQ